VKGGVSEKLHNEELSNIYESLSVVRTVETVKLRWAGHVAGKGVQGLIENFGGKTFIWKPEEAGG